MKIPKNPFRRRDGGNSLVHVGSSVHFGNRKLKVSSKVAEGGSAFIYKVKDQSDGSVFALKQLILADSDVAPSLDPGTSWLPIPKKEEW